MKFLDIFELSIRMFKARPSRTILTILGMSVGIGAILFLVSFGYGLQKTLLERITTSDSLLTLDVTEAKSGLVKLDSHMIDSIKAMQGVQDVSPSFQLTAQAHLDNLSANVIAIGAMPSYLKLGGIKINAGAGLSDQNSAGVIITKSTAQLMGDDTGNSLLGKKVKFTFFVPAETDASSDGATNSDLQSNFTKIDLDKEFTIIGMMDGEDNSVLINSGVLGDLKVSHFSGAKIRCADQTQMAGVRDKILQSGLLVSSLSDTVDQANQIFSIVQIILMSFGIIALIVSAIGMFNTMTIALLERTEEIGIMKSIGASDLSISLMFVMESAIMGLLGGIGGVGIGFLGGKIFNIGINLLAAHFHGESVNLFYSPLWFVLAIIAFAAVVGFMTGFVPARRASKIDPLDALRYK